MQNYTLIIIPQFDEISFRNGGDTEKYHNTNKLMMEIQNTSH